MFILIILNILEKPVEISSLILLTYYLVLDLVKGVIVPLVVITRSRSRLPQLFSKDMSAASEAAQFYVRTPDILPRQLVPRMGPSSESQHHRLGQTLH